MSTLHNRSTVVASKQTDAIPFPLPATDWIIVFNPRVALPKKKNPALASSEQTEKTRARKAWDDVVTRLLKVGLKFQIREWGSGRLAIFVWCPDGILAREVYRSRVLDWLNDSGNELEPPEFGSPNNGTEASAADKASIAGLSSAERLRVVHELLTTPTYEGGAGLTMEERVVGRSGAVGGKYIEAIYAPHDREFEKQWIKSWSKKWLLKADDITKIRDYCGEKVAYYFAFLQFYFLSLAPPSVAGLLAYYLDDDFNPYYGFFMMVWGIVMIAVWNRKASQWASAWGTRNYSKIEKIRPEFRPETLASDPITGERIPYYAYWKRWAKIASITLPVTAAMSAVFFAVVWTITTAEVFTKQYYDGPFENIVTFVPTIFYAASIPALNSFYVTLSHRLNDIENRATDTSFESSYTQKLFIFNSLVAWLSLFAVSWFFIPLSDLIGTRLHSAGYITKLDFDVGPSSLRQRLSYFVVTGQVINALTELVLPMVMTKAGTVMKGLNLSKKDKAKETEEERFLRHAKVDFQKPEYDVYADYAEMVIQFGYLSLFSVAWPLAPLASFVNNFIELRSDAFKIAKATRRPVPQRADNIGPWLRILILVSWLGSITTSSITLLYRKWDPNTPATAQSQSRFPYIVLGVIIVEHLYFLISFITSQAISSVPHQGAERRKRAEFEVKRKYLLKGGIDVLAGTHGGEVEWRGGDEDMAGANREKSVLYGLALKEIHGVLQD
ncbi:hypothetical protein HK104_010600 [Borealophlyctis nickersoniae]|nr:hypothetical protein HK104_010600 [Borealophlyctis nickersoniae]